MPQIDKDKIIRRQMDAVDDMGVEQLRDKFAELKVNRCFPYLAAIRRVEAIC